MSISFQGQVFHNGPSIFPRKDSMSCLEGKGLTFSVLGPEKEKMDMVWVSQKLICINSLNPLFLVQFSHTQLHWCSSSVEPSILLHSENKLSLFCQLRKVQSLGCYTDLGRRLGIQSNSS